VRLLLLWSDDSLTFVEDGEVVWGREEALASVSSSLLVELPTGKAAAPKGAAASDDDGSSGSSGGSKGGLLGFLQDRDRLRSWVRLQMLSVLVQFKLNTDAERGEFDSLRQQLRCVSIVCGVGGGVHGAKGGGGGIHCCKRPCCDVNVEWRMGE
jgi:hypothetical protein